MIYMPGQRIEQLLKAAAQFSTGSTFLKSTFQISVLNWELGVAPEFLPLCGINYKKLMMALCPDSDV